MRCAAIVLGTNEFVCQAVAAVAAHARVDSRSVRGMMGCSYSEWGGSNDTPTNVGFYAHDTHFATAINTCY